MTLTGMAPTAMDFHLHSTASDGELSPADLVEQAYAAGVRCMALTDHDTFAGLAAAQARSNVLGMTLISGVEISARWREMDVHIVGLGVLTQGLLEQKLNTQWQLRQQRAWSIARKLAKLGYEGCYEEAQELVPQGIPARPHFAEILVRRGACRDKKHAFQRLLAVAKPAYVKTEWPQMAEVIQWIRGAEGVAVLAHPGRYKLTRTKLNQLVREFAEQEGHAMEVVTATQNPDQIRQMANLAIKYGLYASRGTDYHGPSMRWIRLGWLPVMPAECLTVESLLSIPSI